MDAINIQLKWNRSSFSFYSESVWEDVKAANRRELAWGVGQVVMKQYKALPEAEHAFWDKKAVDDRDRNQKEMEEFEEKHDSVLCQSPFFLYANYVRSAVKAANPEARFGDIANICAKQFDDLPQEVLDYWHHQANVDEECYERSCFVCQSERTDKTNVWSPLFVKMLAEYSCCA